MRAFKIFLLATVTLLNAVLPAPTLAQHVAAAADLQFALPEIVAAYVKQGGESPKVSYGSSGNFARQIIQGAPFELFLSADEFYVEQVIAAQRHQGTGLHFATGRLALFLPNGSRLVADRDLADLAAAAKDGRLKRLAIANPEHAPYGRAAREALEKKGIWTDVQTLLVLGDNAAQAAQFAASGAAQAGLIPLSLARAPEFSRRGAYATIPENWHSPLKQTLVLISGAGADAQRLAIFLRSPEAQRILSRHGFGIPPVHAGPVNPAGMN